MIRIKVVNSSKATGQLQHAGRQKQGWNPLLPDAENCFSSELKSAKIKKGEDNESRNKVYTANTKDGK